MKLEKHVEHLAKAEIILPYPIDDSLTFSSSIFDVKGDLIFLYQPIQNNIALNVSRFPSNFLLKIFAKTSILQYPVTFVRQELQGETYICIVRATGEPLKIQQRGFFRIERTLPIHYRLYDETPESDEPLLSNGKELIKEESTVFKITDDFHKGETKDLSANGMRFNSHSTLEIESTIQLVLDLDNKQLVFTAKIIDATDNDKIHDYPYQYRITFSDITQQQQDHISEYIWKQQQRKQHTNPLPVKSSDQDSKFKRY